MTKTWAPAFTTGVFAPVDIRKGTGGPEDHSDPNPVSAHHVYLQMSTNFPPKAIEWVNRARWVGPVNIPWERVDTHDIGGWAASRQPDRVAEFEKMIKAHKGDVKPGILIQDDDSPKAIVIDGHHRALAWHNLGMPVLAYLGNIDPKDREAAEQTHGRQIHSGTDPRNKVDSEAELLVKLERLWFSRQIGRPPNRREIYQTLAKLRDWERDETLLEKQAADFGLTMEQLDSSAMRSWLYPEGVKSERTPVVSTQHNPLGEQGLWHTPSKKVPEKQQLPAYVLTGTEYCSRFDARPGNERIAGYCHRDQRHSRMGRWEGFRWESQSHPRSPAGGAGGTR